MQSIRSNEVLRQLYIYYYNPSRLFLLIRSQQAKKSLSFLHTQVKKHTDIIRHLMALLFLCFVLFQNNMVRHFLSRQATIDPSKPRLVGSDPNELHCYHILVSQNSSCTGLETYCTCFLISYYHKPGVIKLFSQRARLLQD